MSWLSKLLGQKEKPEVKEEIPEEEQDKSEEEPENCEEEIENPEDETLTEKSTSKRAKQTKKNTPSSDVAKSTYIPVPENDACLVAAHFGMLRPGGVAAALYIEQMPTKPFVVYGYIACVCTDLLPISLSVVPGLHTEHAITCLNCKTKISGSKGAVENYVIVTAGIDEVSQLYKHSKISIMLDKVTNI
jgi:uncharacterized membrane protein